MQRRIVASIVWLTLWIAMLLVPVDAFARHTKSTAPSETKGKTCRMEQQCHWENFKKICTYVKVCR